MRDPRPYRLPVRWAVPLLAVLLGAACDDGVPTSRPGDAIPRERFVEAMSELRAAAALSPAGVILPGERDEILSKQGLTDEELLRFAEVHGVNVTFMSQVWDEVQRRTQERLGIAEPVEVEIPDELIDLPELP